MNEKIVKIMKMITTASLTLVLLPSIAAAMYLKAAPKASMPSTVISAGSPGGLPSSQPLDGDPPAPTNTMPEDPQFLAPDGGRTSPILPQEIPPRTPELPAPLEPLADKRTPLPRMP